MPKYETAGKFWPMVHNTSIFALVLMQLIAIGIFGLKKLSTASTLTVPLPILTLLFNEYCRKRFLPNFHAYSAEVCQIYIQLNPLFHFLSFYIVYRVRFFFQQLLCFGRFFS